MEWCQRTLPLLKANLHDLERGIKDIFEGEKSKRSGIRREKVLILFISYIECYYICWQNLGVVDWELERPQSFTDVHVMVKQKTWYH